MDFPDEEIRMPGNGMDYNSRISLRSFAAYQIPINYNREGIIIGQQRSACCFCTTFAPTVAHVKIYSLRNVRLKTNYYICSII
jgi:hypothetical protein